MKIELEVSEENESTDSPWWFLVDPKCFRDQIEGSIESGEVPDDDSLISTIAMGSIEGPFFSREEGESYLKSRRYAYSSAAIIWCGSGYYSQQYKNAIREARKP